MVEILKIVVAISNELHDFIINFCWRFGLNVNDKQLHFIVIAIIGMLIYILVDRLFKTMSKYSISILSFIYTFTVLVVIVIGIEVGQKITGRGNMEFNDIVSGLWGFIAAFAIYVLVYNFIRFIKKKKIRK